MKTNKHFTIDEELLPKIKKEAKKEDRSESFIVNKILTQHYERRTRT